MIHTAVQYGAHVTPEDVVRLVNENGGATISNDWRIAGGGWLVGLEGFEVQLPALDAAAVHSYMASYNPAFMGLWRNPETGTIFLDTVAIIDDKMAAIDLGIANNQLAIYNDLEEVEEDLRNWHPNIGLASVRTARGTLESVGQLGTYTFEIQRARGWAASKALLVAPDEENWVALSSVRLGASVQENAISTIQELMGVKAVPDTQSKRPYDVHHPGPSSSQHKPARADIQKMKDARDLHEAAAFELGPLRGDIDNEEKIQEARDEWNEKYGLTDREQKLLSLYKYFLGTHGSKTFDDQQASFQATVSALTSGASQELVTDSPFNIETEQDAKKELGKAIKKYEQQNWPMLYNAIERSLDDAYRQGPLEAYKLYPRMVQWIKDAYEKWLWHDNISYNRPNQSPALPTPHIVDVTTAGGAVLNQLRQENKLPQNFDVNKLGFKDFERWFMEWKAANRASESQGEVVYEFHDGWTIQKLTTPEQLQFEGDEMGHCVGDYVWPVGEGKTIIYSLRDKKGEPHVTMEMQALEGPRNIWEDGDEIPEDVAYNHEYIHPHDSEPGWHRQEKYNIDNTTSYVPTGEAAFQVVQVQGNSNLTPKPEYQHKIKEFLDSLRAKGWKFERSPNWYPNDDAREEESNTVGLSDWEEYSNYRDRNLARNLDDWYDEHYKPNNHSYRGGEGTVDAYGMQKPPLRLNVGNSWHDLFVDCLGSLVDEYDPGRWRGRWQDLAQAVWHAWHVEEDYHPDRKQQEADAFQKELDTAAEKLMEWTDNHWYYAAEHQQGEIYDKVEELLQKENKFVEITRKIDEEQGDVGWDESELIDYVQEHEPEIYEEAQQAIQDEATDYYAGDAFKFLSYLNMLLGKTGLVHPNELPDPQHTNGGLPSYEDLKEMPWKGEEKIPGTFSRVKESIVDIGKCQCGGSIGADGYCMQCGRFNDEFWRPQRVPRYQQGVPQQDPRFVSENWQPLTPTEKMPGTFASVGDYQIHPIDQEHNTWFDEDGNERQRWRPGWAKDPDTGKMKQTGELEDTFLDKQGRQGQGYVAYHGDRPIGSLTYVDDPAGWYMLGTAYTHPDYREQGVFNRLVAPLRETGRPIDAYVWNNPWLKQKVRGWQMKTASDYVSWDEQRRLDEEMRQALPAPMIKWVNNESPYQYSYDEAPDFGLPFLYHQPSNSVWIGTHPTFHSDIEQAEEIPYPNLHGRFNHLRHRPSEHYDSLWRSLSPAAQEAIKGEILKKHPEQMLFDEHPADAEDDGWDEMF